MTISGTAVLCLEPDGSGGFRIKEFSRRKPAPDEIEVAVAAAAVNPIDVRRAQGYGRKLLSAIGAGKFPLVLGNDFAGHVTSVGSKVTTFNIGDRVYGAKPPSAEGTHASHVLVKAIHALRAPPDRDLESLAALPYSFVTMWLAVRGAGLTRENAAGKNVLMHGAAGGLGTLATRMLSAWGAGVTAIARPSSFDTCRQAGATDLVDCTATPVRSLSRSFDATLNFATWEDDLALIDCLRDGGLGHATTVHPMLNNIDRLGWLRGVLKSISEKRRRQRALPKGVRNYVWTMFKPDTAALVSLAEFVKQGNGSLRIGLRKPLKEAAEAFDHTRKGKPGRAVLLP